MATELFRSGEHRCIAFHDLVRGEEGVQANQFLIIDGRESALIDPGGSLLYTPLSIALTRYVRPKDLTWILASHQDPDVIGSVDSWLLYTDARIVSSKLWGRFIPHSVPHCQKNASSDRYVLLEDTGGRIPFGGSGIQAIPAHFLHSVGNFHFYDPVSRILFTGDLGASMTGGEYAPVQDIEAHIPAMAGFHRRYMGSNRACRWWARRARLLDISMIVPQHGLPIEGAKNIARFIEWIDGLQCGIDLLPNSELQAI